MYTAADESRDFDLNDCHFVILDSYQNQMNCFRDDSILTDLEDRTDYSIEMNDDEPLVQCVTGAVQCKLPRKRKLSQEAIQRQRYYEQLLCVSSLIFLVLETARLLLKAV